MMKPAFFDSARAFVFIGVPFCHVVDKDYSKALGNQSKSGSSKQRNFDPPTTSYDRSDFKAIFHQSFCRDCFSDPVGDKLACLKDSETAHLDAMQILRKKLVTFCPPQRVKYMC